MVRPLVAHPQVHVDVRPAAHEQVAVALVAVVRARVAAVADAQLVVAPVADEPVAAHANPN